MITFLSFTLRLPTASSRLLPLFLLLASLFAAPSVMAEERSTALQPISFPAMGSLSLNPPTGVLGANGFRFGVATAATQIEDHNRFTNWWWWANPKDQCVDSVCGLGHGAAPIGKAVMGWTKLIDDVNKISALNVDSYRFSVSWARIMPQRGHINEESITKYREFLEKLKENGIRPMITVHHYSTPAWLHDPHDPKCLTHLPPGTSTNNNLCGFLNPVTTGETLEEYAKFAKLLGERFGHFVDEWATFNEPNIYILEGYGLGKNPPGLRYLVDQPPQPEKFNAVVDAYMQAHVVVYNALKRADKHDADGDGVAAIVGLTLNVADWVAAHDNRTTGVTTSDTQARDLIKYIYHYMFPDAFISGSIDIPPYKNIDPPQIQVPQYKGTLDWLGLQYYFRAGVTGSRMQSNTTTEDSGDYSGIAVCSDTVDTTSQGGIQRTGACIKPIQPSFCVEAMNYEFYAGGLSSVLEEFHNRYSDLPLVVTELGIATNKPRRTSASFVRGLQQVHKARQNNVDVRGYYQWSLMDNWEWDLGYTPHFGLYKVDRTGDYPRNLTDAGQLFLEIVKKRQLTVSQQTEYGGNGPIVPMEGNFTNKFCDGRPLPNGL